MTQIHNPSRKMTLFFATALSVLALTACSTTQAQTDQAMANAQTASAVQSAPSESAGSTADLTVNVSGFGTQQGNVMAALTDEAGYGGKPLRGSTEPVMGETVKLIFKDLPVGTYAIRMFHDVDGNGEMNMNVFGIPTEPYAFSNNAKGMMGPAPWGDAKFDVSADGAVQNITF